MEFSPAVGAITAVLACSLISLISCLVISHFPSTLKRFGGLVLAFGAGAMLGDVFLHILPHASVDKSEDQLIKNGYAFLGGIIVSYLIEALVGILQAFAESKSYSTGILGNWLKFKPVAFTNLLCDLVHNSVDGVSIALAFMAGPSIGISTTIAILAHELAQELGDFVVLVHSGMTFKQATLANVAVSFSALFAACVTLYLGEGLKDETQSLFISAAGGAFLYMGLVDILPEAIQAEGIGHSHNHVHDHAHDEEKETQHAHEDDKQPSTLRNRKQPSAPKDAPKPPPKASRVGKAVASRAKVLVGLVLGLGATALVGVLEAHDHAHDHVAGCSHHHHHHHHHGHHHDHHHHEHIEVASLTGHKHVHDHAHDHDDHHHAHDHANDHAHEHKHDEHKEEAHAHDDHHHEDHHHHDDDHHHDHAHDGDHHAHEHKHDHAHEHHEGCSHSHHRH